MATGEHNDPPPLSALRNLGPKSARMLAAAGIASVDELRVLGAAEAYRRVRLANADGVSLNMLWALQGALLDMDWRELPEEIKAALRAEAEDVQ